MLSKEDLIKLLNDDVEEFNNTLRKSGRNIDLTETDFSSLSIEGAEFIDVDLTSSSFSDCNISESKFENCDMTSVDFTRSEIIESSFAESILNGTDFSYAKLDYCNFSETDMAGAILQGTTLYNTDLSTAENMNACRFDDETVWPDNEYLPEDFDSKYSSDLSSLKDDDDYQQSDY